MNFATDMLSHTLEETDKHEGSIQSRKQETKLPAASDSVVRSTYCPPAVMN